MAKQRQAVSADALAKYCDFFNKGKSMNALGFHLSFPNNDSVQLDLSPIRETFRGGLGTDAVNGGILAAVFDYAIGFTAALVDPIHKSATVQLSMSFMRPVHGNSLRATAKVDHAGKSTVYATAQIFDEQGELCARCQGLVRLSDLPWVS
jgi:uncharacterized protein (TIGR00369 family)